MCSDPHLEAALPGFWYLESTVNIEVFRYQAHLVVSGKLVGPQLDVIGVTLPGGKSISELLTACRTSRSYHWTQPVYILGNYAFFYKLKRCFH